MTAPNAEARDWQMPAVAALPLTEVRNGGWERYGGAMRAYAEAAIKSENSLGLLNITQALIMNALMLFALGFTVWQWSKGKLSVGDLVAVQTYLTQLFRPLDMLGMVYRTIRQGLIDMAAMFALIDTEA